MIGKLLAPGPVGGAPTWRWSVSNQAEVCQLGCDPSDTRVEVHPGGDVDAIHADDPTLPTGTMLLVLGSQFQEIHNTPAPTTTTARPTPSTPPTTTPAQPRDFDPRPC